MTLNWYRAIEYSVFDAREYSARILGTLSESTASESFGKVLERLASEFSASFERPPGFWLACAYVLLVLVVPFNFRGTRRKIVLFVAAFPIPLLLETTLKVSHLPLASGYRWTILWVLQPLMLAVGAASSAPVAVLRPLYSVALFCLSAGGAWALIDRTMDELPRRAGAGALSEYTMLYSIATDAAGFRTVSAGNVGMTPIYYGFSMFDGLLPNSPYRRNYFLAYAASDPPLQYFHTHRHFFYAFPERLDLSMFEFANVKYVISDKPLNEAGLKLVASSPPRYSDQVDYALKRAVGPLFGNIRLLSSIFVYELGGAWPRFFEAKRINCSPYSFRQKEFYTALKRARVGDILFASEDVPGDFAAWKTSEKFSIKKFVLDEGGARVTISGGPGVLAFNQVYTMPWLAFCNDRKLALAPANGVMMAINIPADCGEVRVIFLSPNS
jgi:hypothetical protein